MIKQIDVSSLRWFAASVCSERPRPPSALWSSPPSTRVNRRAGSALVLELYTRPWTRVARDGLEVHRIHFSKIKESPIEWRMYRRDILELGHHLVIIRSASPMTIHDL
jgi:hypothetical protein